MKFITKFTTSSLLSPLLFAIFPILALWETNYARMDAIEVVLPLLEALLAAILLYFIARMILRNAIKASLLSTFFLLVYFTYGHVYDLIEDKAIFGLLIGRHRVLVVVWLLILLAGSYAILRYGTRLSGLAFFLNRAGLALLVLSVVQLAFLQISSNRLAAQHAQALTKTTSLKSSQASPDVYLIVMDAYMRSDVLRRDLNYDNSAFLKQLTDLGFVIPPCTQSNYAWTALSMSSMFNMDYVDKFTAPLDPGSPEIDYNLFTELIVHSQVREQFQNMGYKIVSFQEGYRWVEIPDADTYYRPKSSTRLLSKILSSSEFGQMLSATTLYRIAMDAQSISPALASQIAKIDRFEARYTQKLTTDIRSSEQKRYDFITYSFEAMQEAVNLPAKKFVYMHIPAPHPAWVLDSNGNYSFTTDEKIGYPAEITYLHKQVIPMIKSIIQHSKNPPVIILQGDHGWGAPASRRMYILNAYYLPGAADAVYTSITPVNTFRMVFNIYFGGSFARLPDVSYFSAHKDFYDFVLEPQNCPK